MTFRRLFLLGLILCSWLIWGYSLYLSFVQRSFNPSIGWTIEDASLVINRVSYKDALGQPLATPPNGLKKGDTILAIQNARGERRLINGVFAFEEMLSKAQSGDLLTVSIRKQDGAAAEIPLHAVSPIGTSQAWLVLLVMLVPMLNIFAATLIGFLKPDEENAFLAVLFFLCFPTIFQQSTIYQFPPGFRELTLLITDLLNAFLSYILMRFFLLFPSPSIIERKAPWIKQLFLALTLLSLGPDLFSRYAIGYSLSLLNMIPSWISKGIAGFNLLMLLTAMISLVLNTLFASGRDERRRMNIILLGTLVGLGPTFLFSLYYALLASGTPPVWLLLLIVATLAVFPLSFIYAIVKHRVLGIRLILRQGLRYTLVSRAFLVLEGVLIFLIIWGAGQSLLLDLFPRLSPGLMALVVAGLVLLGMAGLRELNRRIFPIIDRRFFREAYDAQKILTNLRRSVRQLAAQPEQLLSVLSESIGKALFPEKVAFFLRGYQFASTGRLGDGTTSIIPPERNRQEDFWAACLYEPPQIRKTSPAVAVMEPVKNMAFSAESFIVRHLESLAKEEPEALEVYLDDPKSWIQSLVRNASTVSQAYEERRMLERLKTRLLIPLVAGQQLLGFISLGEKRSEEPYSQEDRELLLTLAEQIAIALDYIRLMAQVAEQEKLKREVEIAKEVQARLFPQDLPVVAGLDYCGHCQAARGVGGDYYDFLLLEPGKIGLALGDISGKGIGAALLMAGLQASLRSHAPIRGGDLELLFKDLNRLMCASVDGSKYATFFYGLYDENSRRLSYVNAGHNPPLLFRWNDSRRNPGNQPPATEINYEEKDYANSSPEILPLEATGMTIGLFLQARYEQRSIILDPGDILVIYSDGVTEANNGDEQEFGEKRLRESILRNRHLDSQGIVQGVVDEVSRFVGSAPQYDDLTLVIAKVREIVPGCIQPPAKELQS